MHTSVVVPACVMPDDHLSLFLFLRRFFFFMQSCRSRPEKFSAAIVRAVTARTRGLFVYELPADVGKGIEEAPARRQSATARAYPGILVRLPR